MTGVIILIVALAVAVAVGAAMKARSGKIQSFDRTDPSGSPDVSTPVNVLTEGDLGVPLGDRATLVQFSTEFCAFCPQTRELLTELAGENPGVQFAEVDAAENMDLTRRFKVFSTPTVLVLRPGGEVASRSSGQQQKAALGQALRSVLDDAATGPGGDRIAPGE